MTEKGCMSGQRSTSVADRRLVTALAVLLAVALSWVLASSPASAALTHPYSGMEFANECAPRPIEGDIAIDETNGYIYVSCDAGPGLPRVIKRLHLNGGPAPFSADEPYLDGNTILYNPGSYNHAFGSNFVSPVAVDNSGGPNNGSLFALGQKPQGGSVDLFRPSGEWYAEAPIYLNVCVCGLDVGPDGHIYVGISNRISKFNVGLTEVKRIFWEWPYADDEFLRADSTGAVWTASEGLDGLKSGTSNLRKLEADRFQNDTHVVLGVEAEELGLPLKPTSSPFVFPDPFISGTSYGFDVDLTNDDLLVNRGNRIEVFSSGTAEAPAYKNGPDFGEGTLAGSAGLAIDGNRNVYVTQGTKILKFDAGLVLPDVVTAKPEIDDIGHASATVRGEVERVGGPDISGCTIEYGQTTQFLSPPIPCTPAPLYIASSTDVTATLPELKTGTTYHYRVHASNANGANNGVNRTVTPTAVIRLHTLPAVDLDPHGATLEGSFDPDNYETHYYFEFGLDTDYGQRTIETDVADITPGVQTVSVPVDELPSGRTFHYRLVARNSLGTTFGPDQVFKTAAAPDISGLRASNLQATSATLNGRIDPSGFDTEYQFEYGPTPDYGSKAPVNLKSIGSGTVSQAVAESITDLKPGVTYHFRLVATNKWGTSASPDATLDFAPPSCPNSHVRQQTNGSYLPDCRAYELVSPGNAGSVLMFPSDAIWQADISGSSVRYAKLWPVNTGLATNPSRLAYYAGLGAVGDLDATNTLFDMYVATRTATGWVTGLPASKGSDTIMSARHACSDDMELCIDHNDGDPFYASGETGVQRAANLWSVTGEKVGTLPTNVNLIPGGEFMLPSTLSGDEILSGDAGHYAFSAIDVAFAPGGVLGAPGSAYDNDIAEKKVTLISRTPSGLDIPQEQEELPSEFIEFPAISTDGSHILMQVQGISGPTHLYMRVDGTVSYDVSRGDVRFLGMTSDGAEVLFMSADKLTEDDTDQSIDVYRWTEQGDKLTRLSGGNGQGNSDDCAPGWKGGSQCDTVPLTTERGHPFGYVSAPAIDDYIAARSGDVYFYSPESLDPEKPGVRNARNLYVHRSGAVHLVGTLDPGTEVNRMQISPDGGHAGFLTAASLTGYDTHGFREMYAYDADSGQIQCVSCRPDALPPTANVVASQSGPFMSDDGRVFYATADALVPGDVNGRIIDVYEFVGGRPQLITSGTGSRDSTGGSAVQNVFPIPNPARTGLESVSADGRDVFFSTYDSLVPQDQNGPFIKFYNARTGGGFDPQPSFAPCAAADECHGPGSSPPAPATIGTAGNLGDSGNVQGSQKNTKQKKPKSKKKRQKKRHKRHPGGARHG